MLLSKLAEFAETNGTDEEDKSILIFGSWEQVNKAMEFLAAEILDINPTARIEVRDHDIFFLTDSKEEARVILNVLQTRYEDFKPNEKWGVYHNPKHGTWTCLDSILEYNLDCNFGFSDEHTHCGNCYKVVKTTPNGFWDCERYIETKAGELICRQCCLDDTVQYLEDYRPGSHCILKPEHLGYEMVGVWRDFVGRPDLDNVFIPRTLVSTAVRELKSLHPVFYSDDAGGMLVAVPDGKMLEARNILFSKVVTDEP